MTYGPGLGLGAHSLYEVMTTTKNRWKIRSKFTLDQYSVMAISLELRTFLRAGRKTHNQFEVTVNSSGPPFPCEGCFFLHALSVSNDTGDLSHSAA